MGAIALLKPVTAAGVAMLRGKVARPVILATTSREYQKRPQ